VHAVNCREPQGFMLHFEPLVEGENAIAVPCDGTGRVDLDVLEEAERNAYFYARAAGAQRFVARVTPLPLCP
jgi:hypothetical protein